MARFFKNSFIWEDETLLKIILKGRGFRGGSDEKMRRMWLGLEIDVVGLPPLCTHTPIVESEELGFGKGGQSLIVHIK